MISLRSFTGLALSLVVHGSVGAFILAQNFKAEKPKPKNIAMQMAMFKIAPPPPVVVAKPVETPPLPKSIVKVPELIPKPVLPLPVKPPIKEVIKEVVKKVEPPKPVLEKIAVIKPIKKLTPKPRLKKKKVKKNPVKKIIKKKVIKKKILKKRIIRKKIVKKKKLRKKKRINARKTVKKKRVVKPRRKAPPKRKAIVKRRVAPKKPHHVKRRAPVRRVVRKPVQKKSANRQGQRPVRRVATNRNVAKKRVARHVAPQRRAPVQHRKPKKTIARAKPVVRKTPVKPRVVANPQLEKKYELGIRQRIQQKKVYPRRAKRMRKQGVVKVAFTISKNGMLSKLRILQSSGVKSLDKAALQAVQKVGRFPAFPAGIRKQAIRYIIPIAYRLR